MHKDAILLIGSYGRGNIGDDAFLLAALQLFGDRPLYINSADDSLLPKAVKGKVKTIATASGSGLAHKLKVFMSIKAIVYNGGDLWVELYGDRFPRQSLYKMALVNLIARLCGKKVYYMGCGIGKLSGYSLWLARLSARLANAIVVREQRSASVLNLPHVQVLPDLVTNLDIKPRANRPAKRKQFVIGVSVLWHLPNPEQSFPALIETLSKVLGKLPAETYKIILFPMLASPHEDKDDVWASQQLRDALPATADVSIFEGREVSEYAEALKQTDVLIGARLHANIIALLAGVPSIGISYRPKVAQFFASSGLAEYCIDLDKLTPEALTSCLHQITSTYPAVTEQFLTAREHVTSERTSYQTFISDHF
jgi:polysaccharide pyruvyl transferase WcaK-like protein